MSCRIHPKTFFLILPALLVLFFSPAGSDAEVYCAGDRDEFLTAMSAAAANDEDDIIRIRSGAVIGRFRIPSQAGRRIRLEGGYDYRCVNRIAGTRGKKAAADAAAGALSGETSATFEPQQSTTGPVPPMQPLSMKAEVDGDEFATTSGLLQLLGVPAYTWRHGCGPTALGMVLGYYDMNGFPDLFDGSATEQTDSVNQGIASERDETDPGHYQDYSLPIDFSGLLPDRSELPEGDEHENDCIADFMETSWSSRGNRYGWTWSTDIRPAFINYVQARNPSYQADTATYYMSTSLSWELLTGEIDNGRPMIFLVDTDGNGVTDHFVTVVGYNDVSPRQYGCYDTWSDELRWYDFAPTGVGQLWGVWGGWTFSLLLPVAGGDVDSSGGVDLQDAIVALQIIAGMEGTTSPTPLADVNGDARIGLEEAIYIIQSLAESAGE